MSKADEITNGNTNKIYLHFEIDVPTNNYDSNFNTLVLDVFKIKEMDRLAITSRIDIEVKNRVLEEIQEIAELLKYKRIER